MEGIVAMNKNQRQVYQLATEVIRRKPKRQRVLAVGWEVLSPGKADRDAGQEERCLAVIHGNRGRVPHNRTDLTSKLNSSRFCGQNTTTSISPTFGNDFRARRSSAGKT